MIEGERQEGPSAQSRRVERAELGGEYAGWWIDFDADLTFGALDDLWKPNATDIREAFTNMLVAWNFKDKHGGPLTADAAGMREVGLGLFWQALVAVRAVLASPKAERTPSPAGSGQTAPKRKASTPRT